MRAFATVGLVKDCEVEFGYHTDHSTCKCMMNAMSGDDYYGYVADPTRCRVAYADYQEMIETEIIAEAFAMAN